jgi:hypothetical protein
VVKMADTNVWQDFRDDESEPISIDELKRLKIGNMPDDVVVRVSDNYFPETQIQRVGDRFVCDIEEHLYTNYWEHKFSAYAFAEAMERAVRRLEHEGHPLSNPTRDDEDVHIFVRWQLTLPSNTRATALAQSVKSAFELVWHRAGSILDNSDSVLVLGKDTGAALDRLKQIAMRLEELGYYTYIIKEQPDKPGESVIPKGSALRPVVKVRGDREHRAIGAPVRNPTCCQGCRMRHRCVAGKGQGRNLDVRRCLCKAKTRRKVEYRAGKLDRAVDKAAAWAEKFVTEFADYQVAKLPWLKK